MNELNETQLDERRDHMVSALYGELGEPELQALQRAIADDAELQAEWRELQSVRHLIQTAEEARSGETSPDTASTPTHPTGRLYTTLSSSRLAASGLGFAAAATLFVCLLIGGLRIDRTPEGWLVRLDGSLASDFAVASAQGGGANDWGGSGVSHAEMTALTRAFAGATAARLDELERRQVESQADMTQALYDAILINQQQQYADLRNRIERVAYTAGTAPLTGSRDPTGQIIHGGMNHDN